MTFSIMGCEIGVWSTYSWTFYIFVIRLLPHLILENDWDISSSFSEITPSFRQYYNLSNWIDTLPINLLSLIHLTIFVFLIRGGFYKVIFVWQVLDGCACGQLG